MFIPNVLNIVAKVRVVKNVLHPKCTFNPQMSYIKYIHIDWKYFPRIKLI